MAGPESLRSRLVTISRAALLASLGTLASASAAGGPQATAGAVTCDVAAIQKVAPSDTRIVEARWLDAPVRHCRVDGYVTTENPGPNRNNFRLQLPEKSLWAGRFFFIGLGGSGGAVPTEAQVPRGNPLVKGFAVAGTDKGHQSDPLDWSFASDPAKALDNAHRGGHVTTGAAQAITRAFYGVRKMHRYHTGCSGGGDMGMRAMQYHPDDYDGVLLGWIGGPYPGDPRKTMTAWNYSVVMREMVREPGSWISPAKRQFLQDKALALCDAADGAKDEMIWDSRQCKLDLSRLACTGGDRPDCLSGPEITSVTNIVRDTVWPISNISSWSTYMGSVPPPWDPSPSRENAAKTAMGYVILNNWARTHLRQPDRDVLKQPLTEAEVEQIYKGQLGAFVWPGGAWDLAAFEKGGGKSIFYVGVGDPAFPHDGLENWFRILTEKVGASRRDGFARLYQVPGWGHCGGGTGPDDGADVMLEALVNWVEKGTPPRGLEMHRGADRARFQFASATPGRIGVDVGSASGRPRDFLVCPYPYRSVFDRSKASDPAAVYDARNWSCRKADK
ncbi:tannase/feruloyl esterase family alpha/beta hydrolase [Novosphingobium sp. TH158]|uniref:tannase/feruloyl esterase family alpha/beta hydrolase n=1 Tax=Novosphingobium sp. TH158 TaxID=2067455 RepID=UPI001181AB62|nr:tannase/feruloyl esterase family alpha/beta hydrolase [Novosphingobium sp. TH158]